MVIAAPSAHAQFDGAAMDMTGMGIYAMEEAVMDAAREDTGSKSQQAKPIANDTALNFRANNMVREKVYRNVLPNPPLTANNMVDTSSFVLIGQSMKQLGLSADNVADAFTFWSIGAWQTVHQQYIGNDIATYRAVQNQITKILLSNPAITSASDAQKQEMAETMILELAKIAVFADTAKNDPAQRAQLAKAVNEGAKTMGFDLSKMTLTNRGFAMR